MTLDLDGIDFEKGQGLVVVVAQDARTRAVLMVAFADREALERTLATGDLHFRSRTRGLWRKGETSGNVLRVVSLKADCDGDAILAEVEPHGPTCHTGTTTCWGEPEVDEIVTLEKTIRERARQQQSVPSGALEKPSYTQRLLGDTICVSRSSAKRASSSPSPLPTKIDRASRKKRPTSSTTCWSRSRAPGCPWTKCAPCSPLGDAERDGGGRGTPGHPVRF